MSGNLFLQIDYGAATPQDDSSRPYTGPQPLWNNASLFLDPPRPTQTQAQVNQPSTLKVRVSNKSQTPVDGVRVRAYVMNPQVGVSHPAQAIESFVSGVKSVGPGSGGSSATDAHVFDCLSGGLPWTPTQTELDNTLNKQGHLCLVANCFQDPAFADPPLEGTDLAANDTFDIVNDQHQGQRNITLLPIPQGGMAEGTPFHFVVNPAPDAGPTTVSLEKLLSAQVQGPSEKFLLLTSPGLSVQRGPSGRGRVFFDPGDGSDPVRVGFSRFRVGGTIATEDIEPAGRIAIRATEELRPATLTLQLNEQERVGSMHAFDIVQRAADGRPLGGLRLLTLVTP